MGDRPPSADREGSQGAFHPAPAAARSAFVEDVIYAQAVLDEARRATARRESDGRRSPLARLASLTTNAFVLLLVGAFITDLLVPRFQRAQEQRAARLQARQQALAQFLLYANSRWQEFYLLPPLVVLPALTEAEYRRALERHTAIKVARYDAYARVQALAIAFRSAPGTRNDMIEGSLVHYAERLNRFSSQVDGWLRNAYCYSNECLPSESAPLDPDFDPYRAFDTIHDEAVELLTLDEKQAALLATHLEDR